MKSPKTHAPSTASDDQVRALLERYRCPIPFHAVRTRFLGGIASPLPLDSPMRAVKALWGGELPAFDSLDDVNELLAALVMGLWNRLSRHQERSAPFRLTRQSFPELREGLAALARLRREEIEGFVDGLFGDADQLDLPERAHKALGVPSPKCARCSRARRSWRRTSTSRLHRRTWPPPWRIFAK